MADNITVKDSSAADVVVRTTDNGGVHTPHHIVSAFSGSLPSGTYNIGDVDIASIAAGDNNIGNVDIVTLPGNVQTNIGTLAGVVTGTYALVIGPPIAATLNLAAIITGIAASTYVQGPDVTNINGYFIKAHPDNTDTVWFGGTGTNVRFPLDSGEIAFAPVPNLNLLWFSVDVAGEKVCWLKA